MSTNFTSLCIEDLLEEASPFDPSLNQSSNMERDRRTSSNKLHVLMFPWVAFGHMTPFLYLSNQFAKQGHRVTFLLPKKAQLKLEPLNQQPHLIHFTSIIIPSVDGLPSGAETASDVPFSLHGTLYTAFDQTRDQLQSILIDLNPDVVFYDFAHWIPSLARPLNIKSLYYVTAGVSAFSLRLTPARKIIKGITTLEELMQPPPGYPPTLIAREEAVQSLFLVEELGSGLSFFDRVVTGVGESDAIAVRTYRELEGRYCDYLAEQYKKPVLYTGPAGLEEVGGTGLDENLASWLEKFGPNSVVYCSFGSEIKLQKEQFQEMLHGFESSGHPFLVALATPLGCQELEEAIPHGFRERTKDKGLVCDTWVPQPQILKHPSVGCFVTHCGYGATWESLLSDCRVVAFPQVADQFMNARLMVDELGLGVEVEKEDRGLLRRESLSKAIKLVMGENNNEVAGVLKKNHHKLKDVICSEGIQERYMQSFIRDVRQLLGK